MIRAAQLFRRHGQSLLVQPGRAVVPARELFVELRRAWLAGSAS